MAESTLRIEASRPPDEAGQSEAREAWSILQELAFSKPPPFIKIAKEFDLGPPAFGTLRALGQPRTMSEIAGVLHCDNSNVTGIIDRLEERGLVERHPAEHDRRVKLLVLTPAGRDVRERMLVAMAEPPQWLNRLPREDQRQLRDTLRRALEAEREAAGP